MIHLRPSGSSIWVHCAAAPLFQSRSPVEPESDEAREGTCAAWVGETVLRGEAPDTHSLVGKSHPNGWVVTKEMAWHVQGYVNLVRSYGGIVSAERHVRLTPWLAGTLDSSVESDAGVLRVLDLKYGMMLIDPFELPQLIIYAGALLTPDVQRVELSIYQPRSWHHDGIHRVWRISADELRQHVARIIAAGERCQDPEPTATPGRHCTHCTARSSCQALASTNYAFHEVIEDNRQRKMTVDELVKEYDFITLADKLLSARKNAVAAEIEARLRTEHIPGMFLKPRKGNRQFVLDTAAVTLLTGVDASKQEPATPAEVERRGGNPAIIALISRQPDIAPKLDRVPEDYFKKLMGEPNAK